MFDVYLFIPAPYFRGTSTSISVSFRTPDLLEPDVENAQTNGSRKKKKMIKKEKKTGAKAVGDGEKT